MYACDLNARDLIDAHNLCVPDVCVIICVYVIYVAHCVIHCIVILIRHIRFHSCRNEINPTQNILCELAVHWINPMDQLKNQYKESTQRINLIPIAAGKLITS